MVTFSADIVVPLIFEKLLDLKILLLFFLSKGSFTYGWRVGGGTAVADQQTQAEQPLLLHHSRAALPLTFSHSGGTLPLRITSGGEVAGENMAL